MVKKHTKIALLKPIALIMVSVLSIMGLASCGASKRSLSGINGEEVYATSGNYSITNAELWKELKWSANTVIQDKILDVIYADYKTQIKDVLASDDTEKKEQYYDYLENQALIGVYSVASTEGLESMTAKQVAIAEKKYVDSYYSTYGKTLDIDGTLTPSDTSDDLTKKAKYIDDRDEYYLVNLYEDYYDALAQKLIAVDTLKDEIVDYDKDAEENDDLYYSDDEIIQYHKENYRYSTDIDAIIIRFLSETEAQKTFKSFGVKIYNNKYYFIPQQSKGDSEYSKYYDDFDISTATNAEKCFNIEAVGGQTAILQLFIEMRNYVYTYRDALNNGPISILNTTNNRRNITNAIVRYYIDNDFTKTPSEFVNDYFTEDNKESIVYTQDDLNDIDKSFKFYVASTLKTDPDDNESRYDYQVQTYGDFSYLCYKINQGALSSDLELCSDEDYEIISNETLKQKMIDEMMWDEAKDEYLTNALDKAVQDAKVSIFDEAVEISFAHENSYYKTTHKNAPNKNVLFSVKYKKAKTNFTVADVYAELEKQNGATIAVDLLSRKAIKDSEEYKSITKSEEATYKRSLEYMLNYFANDQLSSNGYPSSIGKYDFLMLYYHSAKIQDIIDNYYKISVASNKILTNYANNETIFNVFAKFASVAYDKAFNVSASNLLVYVDMDEDGVADTDFDWNTEYNGVSYAEKANQLINYFLDKMNYASGTQLEKLTALVEDYNSSSRFSNGIDIYTGTETEYDPTEPETKWAEYRRFGLYVKITEYKDITNTTEEAMYAEGSVPNELKMRINTIFNSPDFRYKDSLSNEYVDSNPYTTGTGFKTFNGYSLLVVSSSALASSAKFEEDKDINSIYINIPVFFDDEVIIIPNIYNDKDTISTNQVKLFIYEYLQTQTTTLCPTSIQDALTNYLKPVYDKYSDSSTQRELLLNKLLNDDITYTNTSNSTRLQRLMEINRLTSDSYYSEDDIANNFAYWDDKNENGIVDAGEYVTWWDLVLGGNE